MHPLPMSISHAKRVLPRDVHALYSRLLDAKNNVEVVPHEANREVEAEGVQIYPHHIRTQDTSDGIELADLSRS